MVDSNRMWRKIKRPKSITFLAIFVLIIAAINLIRIVQVIKQWHFLTVVLSFPPVYQLISGIVWFVCGLIISLSLWYGRRNTPIFVILGGLFYSIYYWIDRFAISATPFDSNWLFLMIINGLIWIIIVWSLTREDAKNYFGAAYDTGSQNQ